MQIERRDEFLSEEDLDLVNCSDEELDAWWSGVFREVPLAARTVKLPLK